ncbi:MAG: AFG1 family ATPase [Legionellaceae bacterium]|nr:AFG1 family ATPase [Legionellaceae bacterium]
MERVRRHYQQACQRGEIEADSAQLAVVDALDDILHGLQAPRRHWFPWRKNPCIRGLYVQGPVGVGKTWLMDLFFSQLPKGMAARYHFHFFMQQVDAQLRKRQGQRDPLKQLARDLARQTRVLCFDELMVHDVAHAMILAELFQALFAEKLVLIATSNTLPDQLYANGVQRQRFLPAIALIKAHCQTITLVARRDYRTGRLPLLTAWYSPADRQSEQAMQRQFQQLQGQLGEHPLRLQNRPLFCRGLAPEAVWFDFDQICKLPRSQLDYLELARRFAHIFISNIPQLTAQHTAQTLLFIYFVDIMYDNGVRLVLSSAVNLDDLCVNSEMAGEFQRTHSRLLEMQSIDYARRHPYHSGAAFE